MSGTKYTVDDGDQVVSFTVSDMQRTDFTLPIPRFAGEEYTIRSGLFSVTVFRAILNEDKTLSWEMYRGKSFG